MSRATATDISTLAGSDGILVPSTVEVTIRGFSLGSFGGTSRLRLRQNSATGKILVTLAIADGETVGDGTLDVKCAGNVYVQFVAGAANLEGSIWTL